MNYLSAAVANLRLCPTKDKALIFNSLKAGKVARIDFYADYSAIHSPLGLPAALVLLRDLIGATLASPVCRGARCSWL